MMIIVSFWTLKKQWTVAFVVLLLFVSTLPLAAAAASAKPSCPRAGKIVYIPWVDSNPKSATVGTTVTTTVAVYYVDGMQVALSPLTISFRWVGAAGEKIVENAPVVVVGNYYTYTQTVGNDFPTGSVTVFVVACSCSDGQGNSGPVTDVSSDSSEGSVDNSRIEIGATRQQPATQDLLTTYSIPIVIVIVAIIAILLLVLRARKKKT